VRARLAAVDRATLLYAALVAVAIGYLRLAGHAPYWPWLLAAHALLAACAVLAPRARRAGRVGRVLGDWYPMLLLPALYGAIGIINLEEARSFDHVVQRLELLAFGSQVSYDWIREFPNPAFSWIMHACYLAYYPILYASPLGLWLTGRRDAARRTILAVVVTFFLCYLAFILFPVTGPRYMFALAQNPATDIGPARLTQWILDRGDAWGAAFPSSHVAGALVATGMAWRAWRPLGLALALPTAGLVLSVVYGQFHYGVDALSGLLVGGAMLAAVRTPAPQHAPVGEGALRAARP
jgi:membrane-associated phospholipid phosphatase